MEEGRVLACGEAIEGLCYEDAMRWCQRGWQAWRPNWPPGWFLSVKADCVLYLTTKVHTSVRSIVADIGTEDRAAKDWIVKARRHLDLALPNGPATGIGTPVAPPPSATFTGVPTAPPDEPPARRSVTVPWHHKDMEIRLQIAVHEIVQRALADGLAASGAIRSVEHELARIAEQAEASENMAG